MPLYKVAFIIARGPNVKDFEPALAALARDLACLAATTEELAIARRLIEMADEVLALAAREAADSPIYDSATFFLHRDSIDMAADPYADSPSAYPAQRC